MVLILILMHQSISILGLFVNCSVAGRVNINNPPLYNTTEHEKKWSVYLYCIAYSFKKKISYSLAYLCIPDFKLKKCRPFRAKVCFEQYTTYAFLQWRLDHILYICLFLPLAVLFSAEGQQVPLLELHVLPEDSKYFGKYEKIQKYKSVIIAENFFFFF